MLNWPRVTELREEVGEDAFGEVVDLFLEEVTETIDTLGQTPGRLEEQLHFLKGAALNLGFDQFSALCSAGEIAARDGKGDQVDLQTILDCYADTCIAFFENMEQAGYLAA